MRRRGGVEDDAALIAKLMPVGYDATPEQVIVLTVSAWDGNCSQHIPQKVDVDEVAPVIAALKQRIAELEGQLAARG